MSITNTSNRRYWARVNRQISVRYEHHCGESEGVTLNVSEQGARLIIRNQVPTPFRLTLPLHPPVSVDAEPVWEQTLFGGGRVLGVRFTPGPAERETLQSWVRSQLQ